MTIPASPLVLRQNQGNSTMPRTPSSRKMEDIYIDDDDDDVPAGDTVLCSPGAVLRPFSTQATQLLGGRPGMLPLVGSSSPISIVEVPASSPFQKQDSVPPPPPKFISRLAPAGTLYRPPVSNPRPTPSLPPATAKRPATELIELSSDEEEDLTSPQRGDIQRTDFRSHIESFTYRPEPTPERIKYMMRQVWDVFGDKFGTEQVREALEVCKYDLDDAIIWLESSSAKKPKASGKKLVSKSTLCDSPDLPKVSSRRPGDLFTDSPPKRKRRLVQGRRHASTSPPPPSSLPTAAIQVPSSSPASSNDPLVIDLVALDDGKGDSFEAEASPEPDDEEDDRTLKCINESTIKELAALTGMKESLLEPIIQHRPYANLYQARNVSVSKKPGSRKSSRMSIGESVVSAVEVFLHAVAAIDEVVTTCEKKGQTVKGVMDTWDINSFGQNKSSARVSPEKDMPLTPSSLGSSRLKRPLVPEQPKLMKGHCQMKPFQLFGLNWMTLLYNYDIGCILADEMGLGKTCQVISFLCQLVESHEREPKGRRPWPNLIVVPPSTYNNWLIEFEKFAPGLSVIGYRGSQTERADIAYEVQQNREDYHAVLATYSQINSETDVEAMQLLGLNAAIFDEGHKMKNPETKIYRDLQRIPSSWRMLLTGTPVQNNLMEMTSLLNFINPKMFDGYLEDIQYIFSQKITIRDVSNGAFLYTERVKRARVILEPFILQRRKDQVLSDMPGKISNVVYCDLDPTQRPIYNDYEHTFKLEPSERLVAAARKKKGRTNDENNVWIQMRKAALHPMLFRRHFTDEKVEEMARILMDRLDQSELQQPDLGHLIQELKNASDFELHLWCRDYNRLLAKFDTPPDAVMASGKVQKLLELITQYQANGDRVLVFSKFSRIIELLQEVLAQRDIDHRVLMGATDVSERQNLIDEYNSDPSIPVFLLTTGAGGTGINLTAANKVIIFDMSDNPQDDIQAENRAHRLGQTREVEIVRLLGRDTVEELIYSACQKKIQLAARVTGSEAAGSEEADDDSMKGAELEKEVRRLIKQK